MIIDTNVAIIQGDITDMEVDAIVNAANTALRLGAGVAGAIRAKGGPGVQRECDLIGPVGLGSAAITGAGSLKAGFVIHAAGMHPGGRVTAESLLSCVKKSLGLADEHGLKSIAFPAIGTGVGGFPIEECALIMAGAVSEYLKSPGGSLEKVYLVLYDGEAFAVFNRVFESMHAGGGNGEK